MPIPHVVDISHYQPDPDWSALKAGGVVGVILKCTEGTSYVDPTFRRRYDAALAAGLAVSSYHFMRPGSMQTQVAHYLKSLKPRMGERVCLDYEDDRIPLSELRDAVLILERDTRELEITIYSGHTIKEKLGSGLDRILARTSLWLAQYGPTPSWPTGTWQTWSLWQYSDAGHVPGIAGNVDVNQFNGSIENCVKWIGPTKETPAPPAQQPVRVHITTPVGVPVEVTVNGELIS